MGALGVHRSAFSVLLPDLAAQLGLGTSGAGAIQAAMLVAYLAGQVPAGRLADRYSGPGVLLFGLALWSAATALTAAAGLGAGAAGGSAWPLLALLATRVLFGLASACAMPCVTAAVVRWVDAGERAAAIGFVYANFNLGGVLGLCVVPLLADALGGSAAFQLVGAAGVAWAAGGAIAMRRLRTAAPDQQQQEQQEEAGKQQQHLQQGSSLRLDAESWRQVALLCYAHAVIGLGFFLLQNLLPLYLSSLGPQGLAATGRLSSAPWLAAAVVGMAAGSAADGLVRAGGVPTLLVRRLMQAASFAGCGAAILPLAANADPGVGLAVGCLAANLGFYSLSYGGFHAYIQDVAGSRYAGVLQGLTNSASVLAGAAGNLICGAVVDATGGSYAPVFAALAAVYLASAVVWCAATTGRPLQAAE